MNLFVVTFPLLALLVVAVVLDVRTRRIPNWLNLLIILGGLGNAAISGDPTSLSQALLGLLVGFAILVVPFALNAMGGGDIKMLIGIGAWLGPVATVQVYAVGAIAGLIIVLTQCAANGRLTQLFRNSTLIVANFANFDQVGRERLISSGQSLRSIDKPLPYAVQALVGVMVTITMNVI